LDKQENSSTVPYHRSLRLDSHDYASTGAYFVTICTYQRQRLFEHPDLCRILEEQWQALPQQFPGVTLDEFVIMPDHIHFIIWLNEDVTNALHLGSVVGAYKSLVRLEWGRRVKASLAPAYKGKFWQDNYIDRVIRDDFELIQKRAYIRKNPLQQ